MININKVISDIHSDGKYDAMLESIKKTLNIYTPSLKDIKKLVIEDDYYVKEYKDLNRWGELSSVHIKELSLNGNDTLEVKNIKEKINQNITYLTNNEEYEIPSKKIIYAAWTGFITLTIIYVIDNITRVFTHLYITNPNAIYISFAVVFIISILGYIKIVKNHTLQHKKYIQTQKDTRQLIKDALSKKYITINEVYKGETL